MGQVKARYGFISIQVIGLLGSATVRAVPPVSPSIDRLRVGVGEEVRETLPGFVVHGELEGVVICKAVIPVIEGGRDVGIRLARIGRPTCAGIRSACWMQVDGAGPRHVGDIPVAAHVHPPAMGAHIIRRYRRVRTQLLLEPHRPLVGIRVLLQRVHVPLDESGADEGSSGRNARRGSTRRRGPSGSRWAPNCGSGYWPEVGRLVARSLRCSGPSA